MHAKPNWATTTEGKKRSSRNAWKHGILSKAVVLPEFEDAREWEAHRDGTFESLQPEGHLECLLAERIAIAFWKLRRLEVHSIAVSIKTEKSILSTITSSPERLKEFYQKGSAPFRLEPGEQVHLIPTGWELPAIMKYESHIHRQMIQTLHELEAMQTRSQGGHVNLARLDITGAPGG